MHHFEAWAKLDKSQAGAYIEAVPILFGAQDGPARGRRGQQ